jgi:hypothetical protein
MTKPAAFIAFIMDTAPLSPNSHFRFTPFIGATGSATAIALGYYREHFHACDNVFCRLSHSVPLDDTEIDCLVAKGYLNPERRQDHAAIQSAIDDFICHALGPEQDQPA